MKLLALVFLSAAAAFAQLGGAITQSAKSSGGNYSHSLCGLGDSITTWQSFGDLVLGPSIFAQIVTLSQGKIQFVHNAGVSGETSGQILARVSDVTGQACGKVLVLAGTNDPRNAIAISTAETNILAIYSAILAAGQLPIAMTIPPQTGLYYAQISALNAWIRSTAKRLSLPLVDVFAACVDPATGDYKTGYSTDGLHPTGPAGRIVAQAALADLAAVFPGQHALLPYTAADPNNLISNGLFTGGATGGVPTGWAAVNVSGHVTYSIGTDATIAGNTMSASKSTSAGGDNDALDGPNINASVGYAPGDRLLFCGRAITTNAEAGGLAFSVAMYGYDATFSTQTIALAPLWAYTGTDVPGGQWSLEFTVPPATTWLYIEFRIGPGTGKVQLGQMGLYNLTTLGALTH